MDWGQLWEIISAPDNIPIVALFFLVPFFTWYAFRQALANDRLIDRLAKDPELAKAHHRKIEPYREGWEQKLYVWPYLLRVEFLAAIIVTIILMVWSITLNAPLEEPANPNLTMNPAKAPWYFLGLQEMLVYFDPWIAGVVMPTLIIFGLMAIPYIDTNPLGNGYYTFRQRKFAILTFCFGFMVLWLAMVFIGTFIRGPGWMWFWPGATWDHHRLIFETNRDLNELLGITNQPWKGLVGATAVGLYFVVFGWLTHKLFVWNDFNRKIYQRMTLVQYLTLQAFLLIMLALPVKILLRQLFRIKYVMVTPWFNI
ncbi:cytochrome C [Acidobacteria bacterium AH-259-D05]|nr:cytochrome C [Acidobacteria bacterium AH-259-D05]